ELSESLREIFSHVKLNIPLLDAIQTIPAYSKYLKDLCTFKRKFSHKNQVLLAANVSTTIQGTIPPKLKDPGCPYINVELGDKNIVKALCDLGASVNLIPYAVYCQLGLEDLQPTSVTLQLADRSVRVPKGILKDVLVRVENFVYPADFIVLDNHPSLGPNEQTPIILGRPFLSTINSVIRVRNGNMTITFGNMTLDLNIYNPSSQIGDDEEIHEVNWISSVEGETEEHYGDVEGC
ncbi:retropepsin-like aspartic protease, partial [Aciditerrimonas ferrireducens]